MAATKIDTRDVPLAFTQEKFERAVEYARAARVARIEAKRVHDNAKEQLDNALVAESSAKVHLRELADAAAGYARFE